MVRNFNKGRIQSSDFDIQASFKVRYVLVINTLFKVRVNSSKVNCPGYATSPTNEDYR